MAIISTRQNPQDPMTTWIIDGILKIIQDTTKINGPIFVNPPSTEKEVIEILLSTIQAIIENQQIVIAELFEDNDDLHFENSRLKSAIHNQEKFLDELLTVKYDDALDHATLDFMDVASGHGSSIVSDEGHLLFDHRTELTKGDLKPMVREAISRWIRCKIQ